MREFLGCLILVGLSCGCQNDSSSPQQNGGRNKATGQVAETETDWVEGWQAQASPDNGTDYRNPLIRGFGQLANDTSIFQADTGIGEMLAEADAAISDIKDENRAALRDLNRQVRIGQRPPNILVVLADDVGYGDLGCYGQQKIKTPHLDALAAGGARLTDFYAGAITDRSSRWCLMTGYDTSHVAQRTGDSFALRPRHVTLGETLWKAGYSTAMVGYWGLGTEADSMPHLHGFDEWFGMLGLGDDDYPEHLWSNGSRVRLVANENKQRGQYLPDVLISEAISVIKRRSPERPFLLLASFNRPSDAPDVDRYAGKNWSKDAQAYAAALTRMDNDVGRLMHEIAQQGLKENTVILFLSDNGAQLDDGPGKAFFSSNGQLRGGKGSLYEGGLRVPAIINWPNRIRAGTVVSEPFAIWDILPTLADIAGAWRQPLGMDGISMLPSLRGRAGAEREMLYWEVRRNGLGQAARMGKWKVVRPAGRDRLEDVELYDLSVDPGEANNIAAEFPQIVAKFIR